MIDEERLNNFVKMLATIAYNEATTQDMKEMLDDYIDNGVLKTEVDNGNDD